MATRWTLEELTELDLRMQRSMALDPQVLPDAGDSKADVLQSWLREQRPSDPEAGRLARAATLSMTWLGISLRIFSFIAGISAAAALLRTPGTQIMNVSSYLGILIGLQLLLLLLMFAGAILFRNKISGLQKVFLPRQIKDLASPLSLRAWSWRIFFDLQLAGIAFNAGVILMTLTKGITHDLAFGWATTLKTTSGSVHRIVDALAFPWGGRYAPSLEQIDFSRIYTGNQMGVTDPAATAAWWPFIMMCVLFYGLLPRILLSLGGALQLHRHLKHPNLDSPESERLYLGLTRKSFAFSGSPSEPAAPGRHPEFPSAFKPEKPLRLEADPQLIPPAMEESFARQLKSRLGIELDPGADGVLKVIELWQPPLEETLRDLRNLRAGLPPDTDILLLGVGLPSAQKDVRFLPPEKTDLDIWRKRLAELNDPRLGLLAWRAE